MEKNKTKSQIICDAVCGILMLLSIISFILVGFLTKIWHPTWLIIAISGVVCGIIGIISNTATSLKSLTKKDDNENSNN